MGRFDPYRVNQLLDAETKRLWSVYGLKQVTDSTLHNARMEMVVFLRRLKDDGTIPEDVDENASEIEHDGAGLVVFTPPKRLQLYVQDGIDRARTPRFEHDAKCCKFLAHELDHDLYYCDQHVFGPTVIARHSSRPNDYWSGLAIAERVPFENPLGLALALAREAGLIGEKEGG